jgi:cysteine-rich repeat protein
VCGDGIVDGEICDDGAANNDGAYATSIATRRCLPGCDGYGPYCGDLELAPLFGEQCDDGNNAGGDLCSAICLNEVPPINTTLPGGGFSGGGGGGAFTGTINVSNPTRILLEGRAYPNVQVNIVKDGELVGTVNTGSEGIFRYEESGVTPGPATFGFWAEDINGFRSIVYTTTFQVTEGAATNVSGILLPPTIDLDRKTVEKGDSITVLGQAVPNALVETLVISGSSTREEFVQEANSDDAGVWGFSYDTSSLENDMFYTMKARFAFSEGSGATTTSGYSQAISFYLGDAGGQGEFLPDLNQDGFVNIVDFSILLFHWGTDGGDSFPPADINRDGLVDLTDFSILIFYWTG